MARQETGRDKGEEVSRYYAEEIVDRYIRFLKGQGIDNCTLRLEDLKMLAIGGINDIVAPFRKLVSQLPIGPISVEELKQIHEYARYVVTNV